MGRFLTMHWHIEQEQRLLRFAGNFNLETSHAREIQKGIKDQTEKDANVDPRTLVTKTNETIQKYQTGLAKLPDQFQTSFKNNVVKYVLTAAHSFDSDAEKGLDEREFNEYKTQMIKEIEAMLEKYAAVEKEQDAATAETSERAREAAESAEAISEQRIEDATFDPANLDTPDGAMLELQKFDQQSGDLQQEASKQTAAIQTFNEKVTTFEEQKKSASALVSKRGLLANAIFLFPPALIYLPLASRFSKDAEAEKLRAELAKAKEATARSIQALQKKKQDIASYGEKLNGIGGNLKEDAKEKHEKEKATAGGEQEQLNDHKKDTEQRLQELQKQKQEMQKAFEEAQVYKEHLAVQKESLDLFDGDRALQEEEMRDHTNHMKGQLHGIEAALKNPDLSAEQRTELEQKQQELQGVVTQATEASADLEQGQTDSVLGKITLNEAAAQVESSSDLIQSNLTTIIDPAITSMEGVLENLEGVQEAMKEKAESIDQGLEGAENTINSLEQSIAQSVLDRTIGNEKAITAVQSQQEYLKTIEIKDQGLWESTIGAYAFRKVGEGAQWINKEVFEEVIWKKFDAAKAWLSEYHPALGYALEAAVLPFVTLPLGIADAAVGLVGGLAQIVSTDPVETIKNMSVMIGRDPQTGEWSVGTAADALGAMGGALIGLEHLKKGQVGRAAGAAALNILLTATGAGAAAAGGAKAAQVAGLAAKLANAGRVGRAAIYARAAVMHPKIFLKTAVKSYGKGVGQGVKKLGNGIRNLSGAPSRMAKAFRNLGTSVDDLGTIAISNMDDVERAAVLTSVKESTDVLRNSQNGLKELSKHIDDPNLQKWIDNSGSVSGSDLSNQITRLEKRIAAGDTNFELHQCVELLQDAKNAGRNIKAQRIQLAEGSGLKQGTKVTIGGEKGWEFMDIDKNGMQRFVRQNERGYAVAKSIDPIKAGPVRTGQPSVAARAASSVENIAVPAKSVKHSMIDEFKASWRKNSQYNKGASWSSRFDNPDYQMWHVNFATSGFDAVVAGGKQFWRNIPSYLAHDVHVMKNIGRAGLNSLKFTGRGIRTVASYGKRYVSGIPGTIGAEAQALRLQGKWFSRIRATSRSAGRGVGNVTLVRPLYYGVKNTKNWTVSKFRKRKKNPNSTSIEDSYVDLKSREAKMAAREEEILITNTDDLSAFEIQELADELEKIKKEHSELTRLEGEIVASGADPAEVFATAKKPNAPTPTKPPPRKPNKPSTSPKKNAPGPIPSPSPAPIPTKFPGPMGRMKNKLLGRKLRRRAKALEQSCDDLTSSINQIKENAMYRGGSSAELPALQKQLIAAQKQLYAIRKMTVKSPSMVVNHLDSPTSLTSYLDSFDVELLGVDAFREQMITISNLIDDGKICLADGSRVPLTDDLLNSIERMYVKRERAYPLMPGDHVRPISYNNKVVLRDGSEGVIIGVADDNLVRIGRYDPKQNTFIDYSYSPEDLIRTNPEAADVINAALAA